MTNQKIHAIIKKNERGKIMENKYWELREAVDRTWDKYRGNPTARNFIEREHAQNEFAEFCMKVLEKLMDENSDVLARLK